MEGSFLEITLLLIIACMIGLFLHQSNDDTPIINIQNNNRNGNGNHNGSGNGNNNQKEQFEPIIINGRILGPSVNFHQNFKSNLPELGWRRWWINNKTKNKVNPDVNFNGTSVRQYLDNMDNVKNIYMGQ